MFLDEKIFTISQISTKSQLRIIFHLLFQKLWQVFFRIQSIGYIFENTQKNFSNNSLYFEQFCLQQFIICRGYEKNLLIPYLCLRGVCRQIVLFYILTLPMRCWNVFNSFFFMHTNRKRMIHLLIRAPLVVIFLISLTNALILALNLGAISDKFIQIYIVRRVDFSRLPIHYLFSTYIF